MILASQPSPEWDMNLSRGSTMGYEPILAERGKVINLYDFLEEAKTKSYRVMCEAASEHGLEKAINDRVALEIEDYIDQYSAAWSEELLETYQEAAGSTMAGEGQDASRYDFITPLWL